MRVSCRGHSWTQKVPVSTRARPIRFGASRPDETSGTGFYHAKPWFGPIMPFRRSTSETTDVSVGCSRDNQGRRFSNRSELFIVPARNDGSGAATMSNKVSRRKFAKIAGLSAAGIAGPLEVAEARPAPRGGSDFPAGFVWGTATSSYQVEGAVNEDGRGASIWDRFVRIPGKIEDGSTGDRANEHYHRYKEDIALIRELGCKAYRFSVVSVPLKKKGDGKPNPKGLDFY